MGLGFLVGSKGEFEIMVRRARLEDGETVLSLAKDFATSFVIEETAFRVSFEAMLNDPHVYLAVEENEREIRGYVLAFKHNTFYANGYVAWVEEITVEETQRRQGLGTALMHSVEEWAANCDCKLVALATRRAANFYEATGYQASATYFRKSL